MARVKRGVILLAVVLLVSQNGYCVWTLLHMELFLCNKHLD